MKWQGADQDGRLEFVPSVDLRRAYGRAIGGVFRLFVLPPGDALWYDAHSALVSEARFQRSGEPVVIEIAPVGAGFLPVVEEMLLSRLEIRRERSQAFLKMLASDLVVYLNGGGRIEGSWGSVGVADGGLVYRLTAKEPVIYERSNKRTLELDI